MKVILLERVRNLGELGEQVDVKPGYSRNYLLPQGKAISANAENVKVFDSRRAELEKAAAGRLSEAQQRAEALSKLELNISARVSEENKLYGSIGATEIIAAIEEKGLKVEKQEVLLPNGPFRAIGDYDVAISLMNGEVDLTIKLSITPVS